MNSLKEKEYDYFRRKHTHTHTHTHTHKTIYYIESQQSRKNDMICESESKNYIIEEKSFFSPAPWRCYCADKSIKHCGIKPAPVVILGYRHRYAILTREGKTD